MTNRRLGMGALAIVIAATLGAVGIIGTSYESSSAAPKIHVITGTNKADVIRGTPQRDRIFGAKGNDRIGVRGGGKDFVFCGKGHDKVWLDHDDGSRDCEVKLYSKIKPPVIVPPPLPVPPTTTGLIYGVSPDADQAKGIGLAAQMGASIVRSHDAWGYNVPATNLDSVILQAAKSNIEMIVQIGFDAAPPNAGAIGSWASRFCKGGTFWQPGQPGAGLGSNAVQWFELGNEDSYTYGSKPGPPGGTAYGNYAKQAYAAVIAANPNCGVLVQGDDANKGTTEWMDKLWAAYPEVGQQAAGWVVHPYGPPLEGAARIDRMTNYLKSHGVSSPNVFVTEDGFSTDNGNGLDNNYGWPTNTTYVLAATLWQTKLNYYESNKLVKVVTYYQAFDQQGSGTGQREHYFGIFRNDGSPKGVFTDVNKAFAAKHHR